MGLFAWIIVGMVLLVIFGLGWQLFFSALQCGDTRAFNAKRR
jgi:hypothetical protein